MSKAAWGSKAQQGKSKRKTPVQAEVPGTEVPRDKALEAVGATIVELEDELRSRREMMAAAKARAAKRLAELGLTIYKTATGKVITATKAVKIAVRKPPKPRKVRGAKVQ